MKRVERESLIKSFALFFVSMNLLAGAVFYMLWQDARSQREHAVFLQMRLCSLDLKCDAFDIDFVPYDAQGLYAAAWEQGAFTAAFPVPRSEKYMMKLSYSAEAYEAALAPLKANLLRYYAGVIFGMGLLSLLFSVYALHPLRRSLKLTEEFVRDILHDVNTPLSALKLNLGMMRREMGEHPKIARMEEGVERIVSLQGNLRSFLGEHALQSESIALETLVAARMAWFEKLYPEIRFSFEGGALELSANREALTRVIDNLLDNAGKYNVKGGSVNIRLKRDGATLVIADTGRGIKEPGRAFERFYREHERGMGIGLHIVKKLCDAMGIGITLESAPERGSTFTLDFSALAAR